MHLARGPRRGVWGKHGAHKGDPKREWAGKAAEETRGFSFYCQCFSVLLIGFIL